MPEHPSSEQAAIKITQSIGGGGLALLAVLGFIVIGLDLSGFIAAPVPISILSIVLITALVLSSLIITYPQSLIIQWFLIIIFLLITFMLIVKAGLYPATVSLFLLLINMAVVSRHRLIAGVITSAVILLGLMLHETAMLHPVTQRIIAVLMIAPYPLSLLLNSAMPYEEAQHKGFTAILFIAAVVFAAFAIINNFQTNMLVSAGVVTAMLIYLKLKGQLPYPMVLAFVVIIIALAAYNSFAVGSLWMAILPLGMLVLYLLVEPIKAIGSGLIVLAVSFIGLGQSSAEIDFALLIRALFSVVIFLVGLYFVGSIRSSKQPSSPLFLAQTLSQARMTTNAIAILSFILILGLMAHIMATNRDAKQLDEIGEKLLMAKPLLSDLETYQRDYLLSADKTFLESYQQASNQITDLLDLLKNHVLIDPAFYTQIKPLIEQRERYHAETFETLETMGLNALRLKLTEAKARAYLDEVRQLIAAEAERLQALEQNLDQKMLYSQIALTLVLLLSVIYGFMLSRRQSRQLDALVFMPLQQFKNALDGFGQTGEMSIKLPASASMELHELSRVTADMVSRIDAYQSDIQAKNKMQSELFAIIGHELRTPAATLQMLLNQPDVAQHEQQINDTMQHLLDVLDDMAVISNPERSIKGKTVKTSVEAVVNNLIDTQKRLFQQFAMQIERNLSKSASILCEVNARLLRQIILNLIKNAAIHGHASRVVLSVEATSVGDNLQVSVFLDDNGDGILPETHETLFTAFKRGDTDADGTGLGLYLSRKFAREALNGDLVFDASYHDATRFVLTMRLQRAPEETQTTQSPVKTLQGMSFLYAEDNVLLRELTAASLEKLGVRVDAVENGQLAYDYLQKNSVDVLLTDAFMPEMDGFTLIEKLRAQGFDKTIVAVTAATVGAEQNRLKALGADHVIEKPLEFDVLAELIGHPVESVAKADVGEQAGHSELFDYARLMHNMSNSREVFENIVSIFSSETPVLLAQIRQAFQEGDMQKLRSFAHKLKGDAASLYAGDYKNQAMLIMRLADNQQLDQLSEAIDQAQAMFEALKQALEQKLA